MSEAASTSSVGALKRAFAAFREHKMTDYAAALTYFAMMSLFPTLLVGVTLLGFVGQESLVKDASDYVLKHGADPQSAAVLTKVLNKIINSSSGALGLTLIISVLLALNGASGAFGASGRALNVVYGEEETRGFVRHKLQDLGATLLVILFFLIMLVTVFLGGQIASDLFGKIGLGDSAATIWGIVRWPIAILAMIVAYALVYSLAPDRTPRKIRWISPGAVFAVLLWIVASILFGFYIKGFSTYGAAYGVFGAAIILLLWLYISANALLFGAELNAELERTQRAPEAPKATAAKPAPST